MIVATDEASGYRATVEQLEAARTPRTKLLVFVSPSNPTGAVYAPEQVAAIGRWAVEHGIWVVTDEIYEHLVYGDAHFASMPVLVPEIADTCVVVNGVAKTYAMTGWRVGWMIGPNDVIKAAGNLQSHATSNVANVSQIAALAAVSGDLTDKVIFISFNSNIYTNPFPESTAPPRRVRSTSIPRSRVSWARRSGAKDRSLRLTSRHSSWTRRRSPSSRVRPSEHRAICACPTPRATPISTRASAASRRCSVRPDSRAGCPGAPGDADPRSRRILRENERGFLNFFPEEDRYCVPESSEQPMRRGSGSNVIPKWSRTPLRIERARSTTSAAVAPP